MAQRNVIIIGAAGRDFHNFNTRYRDDDSSKVVAFTATQIPDIEGRRYPPELAGPLYPDGIPVYPQEDLTRLIGELSVDECVFSYSDVSYQHVMGVGAIVQAAGASFTMPGPADTQLPSTKPVVSVCAVRTGSGKSQTSRRVIEILMARGLKVVAVRHPMPYGNLVAQTVQRFAELADLEKHDCTIEEMEEYEPHIVRGNVIYSGVDYEAILRAAENDPDGCDVVVWDGGNNDFSFFKPDLRITVADPHRAGHELRYYPGEINVRMADVVVINKVDSADPEGVKTVRENTMAINPRAVIVEAASTVRIDDPDIVRGKRALVIEDGPTLTHGGMKIGAGVVAARRAGATELVDPRPYLVGRLRETFETYPDIGTILPAMGYGEEQLRDLEATINATDCDVVVIGTPIDLNRIVTIDKPNTRVFYDLEELTKPNLTDLLASFVEEHGLT
ncbi:MAG: cyclic 2,3-diphosphoglycerate synthase [Acidimicrobiia bacterium]|nr:cyclic 2,3-diphosphoglycerate synthase [Acidimicrobiia bacterium]MDH5616946.1 cyclic 2,3-diphosphoglycerate synthase [Acidimicrobiia bacterium]